MVKETKSAQPCIMPEERRAYKKKKKVMYQQHFSPLLVLLAID
jgi:hypothetical protein